MSLPEIDFVISVLRTKKDQLEAHSFLAQQQLLREFLQHMKRQKDEELFKIQKESAVIQEDLDRVAHLLRELESSATTGGVLHDPEGDNSNSDASVVPSLEFSQIAGFNILADKSALVGVPNDLPARRLRMHHHFEDLVTCYKNSRMDELSIPGATLEPQPDTSDKWNGLDTFSDCLHHLTRYSGMRPLSTLNYTTDIYSNSSIVSSIEFDKDQEFFAIAGVTKRIKIYDYNVVLKDMVEIHYPSSEMVCSSKISCISWSAFHKNTLASSDYEGTVSVWDTVTGQRTSVFQEHEKRCWSVDFNQVDTKLIASGSDDARVKLWTVNSAHSVASLEAKANVCCVKFNPGSPYNLAFGSADHCVHYYDLRSTKKALTVLKGHKKAVSYVKFLNNEDLVSASTDSQLKLWNVNQPYYVRSFTGHVNEKNFVGLATDGDYITCGSENNGLYVYYKGLSKSLFQFKFDAVKSFLDRDRKEEDVNEFVSAVCWKQNSNVIVAANSQGTIKVLELV
ncbi:E3 ubiquitin-protein ligase RFWD2 isoform X2 [Eurytemora carolleeae]|nr:E3 ubiquitin-protein ligase RFWD2 isoform X2 [Eurytemora carolleeae]|eukprot:XP_023349005.1 E3 ubiquitin-protein ligase RFWD2-like isoform X2 [Eurytemora affinis]